MDPPSSRLLARGAGPVHVEAATVIKATPEQIFSFITDPDNEPSWQEGAVSRRVTTGMKGATREARRAAHLPLAGRDEEVGDEGSSSSPGNEANDR